MIAGSDQGCLSSHLTELADMSLVSEEYSSDSDTEAGQISTENRPDSSVPELPQELEHLYNRPPLLNPFDNMLRASPLSKNSCFFFLQLRLSARQTQVLDIAINDVNSLMSTNNDPYFEPLHRGKMGSPIPLHVSLSRSCKFKDQQALEDVLPQIKADIAKVNAKSIPITFQGNWQLFSNFDGSLHFLALCLSDRSKQLIKPLLAVLDKHLPGYPMENSVNPERLHVSVASIFTKSLIRDQERAKINKRIDTLTNLLGKSGSSRLPLVRTEMQLRCTDVKAEVFRDIVSIPL